VREIVSKETLQPIATRLIEAMRAHSAVAKSAAGQDAEVDPMLLATQQLLVTTSVALGDLLRVLGGEDISRP
jgi:hypothetical protein